MNTQILQALRLKYEADIASAKANINVYLNNSVGIGEHPDIVAAVDSELQKMSHAKDMLSTLNSSYSDRIPLT
jgi:hypothetical protein